MKSFFKKVALVLALAMVVTMLPARVVSAADEDLQMRKYMKLYIDGDYTETYGNTANAWVKFDREAYTVAFTSSDEEVATVGPRKGGVTAVGVGRATITATFTNKSTGETVTKECVVDVKRNAVSVALKNSQEEELKEVGIEAGKTYQTAVFRLDADGKKTWKQVKVTNEKETWVEGATTSGIRFSSSDVSIFTVGPTKGLITAVAEGTATLSIWAVQSEKPETDENGNKVYQKVTEIATYDVKVVSTKITAEQTTHKAFTVTFPSDAEAKAAADKTAESLTKASAAVTEDTDIINVYEVLKNTGDAAEKASRMIGNVSVDGNVVTVTMFDEVEQETNYVITYQGKETTVLTAKNVAVDMSVEATVVADYKTETSSRVSVDYKLYTTGSNGQMVDITDCKAYGNGDWKANVELSDLNKETYHADYYFDQLGRTIDFYTVDINNTVTLKAVYEDWSQITENKPYTITKTLTVSAADSKVDNVKLASPNSYAVVVGDEYDALVDIDHAHGDDSKVNESIGKFEAAKKEFAATDSNYRLVVYATRNVSGKLEGLCSKDDNRFTFVSANEDKLIVNKENGYLYPAKEPRNDRVSVYVYYDGEYIGTCPITIWAERKLTTFTAELKSSTLSYNPNEGVDEHVELELKPLDQLKDTYLDVVLDAKVYLDSEAGYLTLTKKDSAGYKWDIAGTSQLRKGVISSIRILCTASYIDDNNNPKEMRYVVILRAKNTEDATEVRYEVVATGKDDLAVKDEDGLRIVDKNITFAAYSYDKDGFKVKHLVLTYSANDPTGTTVTGNKLFIVESNKPVPATVDGHSQITTVGNDVKLETATVTGSSEDIIVKIKAGTYIARLFVPDRNNKAVYKANCTVNLSDSQGSIGWKWVKFSTSAGVADDDAVAAAIVECFNFGDRKDDIYVIGAEDDYVVKGNLLTVKKVRCLLPITIGGIEYKYEIVTDINRTISVNN